MKKDNYDSYAVFDKYCQMNLSSENLAATKEWHVLKNLLPDFKNKRVLDLGYGFGWHCEYAIEQGAKSAVAVDISGKMLEQARRRNGSKKIEYIRSSMEDVNFPAGYFDIVLSTFAFHYFESFDWVCDKVSSYLPSGGAFVFSVEHPIFTAYGTEDWYYDQNGEILHWPVDRYFSEGMRDSVFMGEKTTKYHRTLTTYLHTLLASDFMITGFVEPQPNQDMLTSMPEMQDELRRPMALLVSAEKK